MSLLYGRVASLTVLPQGRSGVRIDGLRMEFSVEKDGSTTPNSMEIKLYNLSDETAASIEKKDHRILLEAGYEGNAELLYVGDVTEVEDARKGVDRITTLKAGDGATAIRGSTLFESFSSGATVQQIFEKVAESMGLPLGEVRGIGAQSYASGFSASGSSRKVLDTLARRLKVRWSVQDGQLQVLPAQEASESAVVLLSPETGLIGKPERTDEGVSCVSLLQPRIRPGRVIVLESETVRGRFKVERVVHTGDTHGVPWESQIEAVEVSP